MAEIWQLTVGELRSQYDTGGLSPRDAAEALIARIDGMDDSVGAFTTRTGERALTEAGELTEELAAGTRRGPLHGIPVGIKELFDVGDAETTYGSPILSGRIPSEDAAAVARLRAAGCVILGLTRSHEFGWGITTQNEVRGSTSNPWSPDRVPGGSSGGTAAALAMGFVPLALGSDTGGSIRIPAALCGVAGLKPTFGRVPKRGAVALAPSLDHPGPLARSAADLAPALTVLAGHDPTDPTTFTEQLDLGGVERGLDGMTVGVCPDLHLRPLWSDHQELFDSAVSALESGGANIKTVPLPGAEDIRGAFTVIQMAEAYHYHTSVLQLFPGRRQEYGSDVAGRLDAAAAVTLSEYIDAKAATLDHVASFHSLFTTIDVLVTPVSAGGPSYRSSPDESRHDGETIPFRDLVMDFTVPQDLAGLPAVAVPVGLDNEGLPAAVQLTAAGGREDLALRAAIGLEQQVPGLGWPDLAAAAPRHPEPRS